MPDAEFHEWYESGRAKLIPIRPKPGPCPPRRNGRHLWIDVYVAPTSLTGMAGIRALATCRHCDMVRTYHRYPGTHKPVHWESDEWLAWRAGAVGSDCPGA